MGKGNQLAELVMKDTKVPEFDEFFDKSSDPVNSVVSWNNELDGMVKEMRALGSDLKGDGKPASDASTVLVEVKDDVVTVTVVKNGEPVPPKALDKVAKEYLSMVDKKAKLVNKRIKTLQKLPGLENATVHVVSGFQLQISAAEDALNTHKKHDDLNDMQRSLTKFNDRAGLLVMQLKGPVTLAEAASALWSNIKDEIKKKGKEIKVVIEAGMPKIEGIPEDVEDFFPSLVARGWKLLKKILDFLTGLKEQIPALQQKLEDMLNEAKTFPSKIKDAATQAGLGGMELMKATKALSANIKTFSSVPLILKTLFQTVQETLLELAGAITGRAGGESKSTSQTPNQVVENETGNRSSGEEDNAKPDAPEA